MPDPSNVPTTKSVQGHIAHYETYIAARKKEFETGEFMVDEETSRKWLAWAEGELATWKRNLEAAEKGSAASTT